MKNRRKVRERHREIGERGEKKSEECEREGKGIKQEDERREGE